MKKALIIIAVAVLLLVGGTWWSKSLQTKDADLISTNGIHWHAELAIYVKGEKLPIPANIGLGAVHNPIHTHDEDAAAGIIHLEFAGLVRKSDTALGEFFKSWNKDIRVFGANMKMTVNGAENTEYENYQMKDGDKIELIYE